jgi:uncharacterized low-complexity protein
MNFTSFRQHMKRVYNLFTPSPLEVLIPSQPCPRFPSPEPGGEGELADGEVEHGVANKCRDKRLGSPRGDWRWQLGRRGRRRAAAATQGQHGRGCAKSGEGTCGAEQCVAHRASRYLGKVIDGLVGSGVARRAELADGCPAAAAKTLAPVSRRLMQANKRV